MQQREIISGFSELKTLLIETYKIDKAPEFIKLYFTMESGDLHVHNYDNHNQSIILYLAPVEIISVFLKNSSFKLVEYSLKQKYPAKFLNEGFKLYGFFRS